jgi:hypothetical protein
MFSAMTLPRAGLATERALDMWDALKPYVEETHQRYRSFAPIFLGLAFDRRGCRVLTLDPVSPFAMAGVQWRDRLRNRLQS